MKASKKVGRVSARAGLVVALSLAVVTAAGAVDEIFSRYVRVLRPQGGFAQQLIRQAPPTGEGWREVENARLGYRIRVPQAAQVDEKAEGARVLLVTLEESPTRPKPVLQVHTYKPDADEPTDVDEEYVEQLVEEYPEAAFDGRFTVVDSGLVALKKANLSLIGGMYQRAAAPAYRMQWTYLAPDRQLFFTFDCAEGEWERHAATLGQILLSLEIQRPAKK